MKQKVIYIVLVSNDPADADVDVSCMDAVLNSIPNRFQVCSYEETLEGDDE